MLFTSCTKVKLVAWLNDYSCDNLKWREVEKLFLWGKKILSVLCKFTGIQDGIDKKFAKIFLINPIILFLFCFGHTSTISIYFLVESNFSFYLVSLNVFYWTFSIIFVSLWVINFLGKIILVFVVTNPTWALRISIDQSCCLR